VIDEALGVPSVARPGRGWTKDPRELLAPVNDRFTEGFSSADLVPAKTLLDALR
jgi:hypothetical protein